MKKLIVILSLALVLCGSIVSCSQEADSRLEGRWEMKDYADLALSSLSLTTVPDGERYVLQLHGTGVFSFTTDCNTVSGEYTAKGNSMKFTDISATELACDKETIERNVKSNLTLVVAYDMPTDSTLRLLGSRGNVLIELTRANDYRR